MTENWRIPTDFEAWMTRTDKRLMRQERRQLVVDAQQILGPGAGPFAVLLNDWNDEGATFNGIFYSEPGALNAPDVPPGDLSNQYWLGETFAVEVSEDDDEENEEEPKRWGFQRLTRYRIEPPGTGDWDVMRRRFYPDTDGVVAYTAWEAV